ncbi:MAG: acylphosphatase [Acidimicrobiales bacterium]
MEHLARRVVVTGRVQGVWYRDSCMRQATRLGVSGWVRNRLDGTVEGQFEGPDAAVEALVAWCRRGPTHADVTAVEVTDTIPSGSESFFIAESV